MRSSISIPSNEQVDGVIQRVDTVNREIETLVNGHLLSFDVPLDCAIVLNREHVKLRLLQPADRARVFYHSDSTGLRTAHCIVAKAGTPSAI